MVDGKPTRLWRIVLVTSLAMNLAVVGVVGGLLLRNAGDKGGPRGFDVGLGPIARVLDREDRRAIGEALRKVPGVRAPSRGDNRAALVALADVLRAEPFSEAALVAALDTPSVRMQAIRSAASEALTARLVAMFWANVEGPVADDAT